MIDLYFWPTSNGKKITIMLEECGLDYRILPINIMQDEQFKPDFLKVCPNNKIPAIVDHDVDGEPLAIFESGAILEYLAEKSGRLLPADTRGKYGVLQWVYWQMGGLGPNAGQAHHFFRFGPEDVPYAKERFRKETARLYGVMDRQLAEHSFLASDDYSIADIAAWPWVARHDWQQQDLDDFPNVKRWFETVAARPAVITAQDIGPSLVDSDRDMTDAEKKRLVPSA